MESPLQIRSMYVCNIYLYLTWIYGFHKIGTFLANSSHGSVVDMWSSGITFSKVKNHQAVWCGESAIYGATEKNWLVVEFQHIGQICNRQNGFIFPQFSGWTFQKKSLQPPKREPPGNKKHIPPNGKRKIIFKTALVGDKLVPRRVHYSSLPQQPLGVSFDTPPPVANVRHQDRAGDDVSHHIGRNPADCDGSSMIIGILTSLPSGKLAWQWNTPIFLIGNASSIRVHFPASYVRLPECNTSPPWIPKWPLW